MSATKHPARLVRAGTTIEASALVARPVALDAATIANLRRLALVSGDVLEHDRASYFGFGEAAAVELPGGIADKLAASAAGALVSGIDAAAGALPRAFGALAFEETAPGRLRLATLALVSDARGETTACATGLPDTLDDEVAAFIATAAAGDGPEAELPDRFELASVHPHATYRRQVAAAIEAIGRGELDKVVIAREVRVRANRPFIRHHLLERLRQLYPSCATFAVDGFVGASPELLVRRSGDGATAMPLAGTIARSGDPDEDARLAAALLASGKERAEHRYVVDAIADVLGALGGSVEVSDPHLLELRNVVHLATSLRAAFASGAAPSALELAAALHPTPAVGGVPREAALAWLAANEVLDRDRYAGALGFLDAAGDGEFYIGIRSAHIDGATARLIAGSGIVAGSDPEAELAETQLKLQALLAAAVRP